MKFSIKNCLIIIFMCQMNVACEKDAPGTELDVDDSINNKRGIIEINFQVPDEHLGTGCVKRAELVLASNADSIYQGKYTISFNVSDEQEIYTLFMKPGSYYYQAVVTCMCETNYCSGAGYAGGQYGLNYTADKFFITENETTFITPQFQ